MEREENNDTDDYIEPERFDLALLAIGKRAGLGFVEINEFRASDLFAYAREFAGARRDKPKQATQADIDKFYSSCN